MTWFSLRSGIASIGVRKTTNTPATDRAAATRKTRKRLRIDHSMMRSIIWWRPARFASAVHGRGRLPGPDWPWLVLYSPRSRGTRFRRRALASRASPWSRGGCPSEWDRFAAVRRAFDRPAAIWRERRWALRRGGRGVGGARGLSFLPLRRRDRRSRRRRRR